MNTSCDQTIYTRYVNETFLRLRSVSFVLLFGEILITVLDTVMKQFDNPDNRLNLAAKIMVIVSSLVFFLYCRCMDQSGDRTTGKTKAAINIYRFSIAIATGMLIYTNVYLKHRTLGSYIILLFILQVTPAYSALTNTVNFAIVGFFTLALYAIHGSPDLHILLILAGIFLCFVFSSDYLRYYFRHKLEEQYKAEISYERYKNFTEQTIVALAGAVEAKDVYTKGHSHRVAVYSKEISRRMGYSLQQQQDVYQIGLMHDIGKIGVPDAIINKTSRLTDEEFMEIKRHPEVGYEILKQITELPGIGEGARWHHEQYNGRGYPDGLFGEAIPEIARIIAVADAYDAMTSNRSYRDTMPQAEVRAQIADNAGTQFDPKIAAIMLEMIDEDVGYHMRQNNR